MDKPATRSSSPSSHELAGSDVQALPSGRDPASSSLSPDLRAVPDEAGSASPSSADLVAILPPAVAESVLLRLSVPDRLRCREVSRAWRAMLAQPKLWRIIDLSAASTGLTVADDGAAAAVPGATTTTPITSRRFAQLLLAAGAAAAGSAELIDLSDSDRSERSYDAEDALKAVLRQNASVRTLRAPGAGLGGRSGAVLPSDAASIIAAAPGLAEVVLDVVCGEPSHTKCWQNAGAPAALRVRNLTLTGTYFEDNPEVISGSEWLAMARVVRDSAAVRRPVIQSLSWDFVNALFNEDVTTPRELRALCEAMADASIRGQVPALEIKDTDLPPEMLPNLSRLLRAGSLQSLRLSTTGLQRSGGFSFLLNGARAAAALSEFCGALRASRIDELRLEKSAPVGPVIGALVGHPTLRELRISDSISDSIFGDRAWAELEPAVSEAFASVVAANSPALRSLSLLLTRSFSAEALGRIFDALRSNTHLASLVCRQHKAKQPPAGVDERFARDRVLPAVRACLSLRTLEWDADACGAAGEEISAIIRGRSNAAVAAVAAAEGGARAGSNL